MRSMGTKNFANQDCMTGAIHECKEPAEELQMFEVNIDDQGPTEFQTGAEEDRSGKL